MSTGRTALEGIRVLDVAQVMAGPFCAMQLCDMGADVIKVEPPAGDPTRQMGARGGSDSAGFAALNRGKRAIVLDLKSAAGRRAFERLAAGADILIENFRPGVMQQLGLDYGTLSATNPRLIYASISGYGQTGPDAAKGGFDLIAQGVSGVMSVTGQPGAAPVKSGVPLTDLGAGLFALAAILAALHHRARTGRGQHIDTSLLEAGLALGIQFGRAHPVALLRQVGHLAGQLDDGLEPGGVRGSAHCGSASQADLISRSRLATSSIICGSLRRFASVRRRVE